MSAMPSATDRLDRPLTRAQKAAAVLLSVGPEVAAEVLRYFTETEVEQVALEIATLGGLERDQLTPILNEFRAEAVAHGHLVTGGEAQAREVLRRLFGAEGDEVVDRLLASVQTEPFHFLRLYEPTEVGQHLREEHPQTIALVMAYLPARFASQIMADLDPDLQAEVARRIALLDRTNHEVISRVENALAERLGGVQRRSDIGRGGVRELAALLNQTDRSTERFILTALEETDPDVAEEVRGLMFLFEDLVMLEDRAIQEVLRRVEMSRLALALKGTSDALQETLMRNLSERARETVVEEIDLLGAVRVREVEEAQQEIVRLIRELDEQGEIVMTRPGEGEFVA